MNFEFYNPNHLIFGTCTLSRLGEVAGKYGKKALIVTDGGSVKRNGTFDCAVASLKMDIRTGRNRFEKMRKRRI